MPNLTIKEFHRFLTGDLVKDVRDRYWKYHVLSEADLQSVVWQLIHSFVNRYDPNDRMFKILNKPYLKGLGIHPDIVVFKRKKPWAVIELKESRRLKSRSAEKERDRLLKSKGAFRARRGYLFYVARYGKEKVLRGPKREGARFFFEIPITLEMVYKTSDVQAWEETFKFWAKFQN